jgi:ADP-ribose pyrophosphatase YjhB (NUDIX family)
MSMDPPAPSFILHRPDKDERLREVCTSCGFINYVNPKIVVGSVVTFGEDVLLCRRAIEPRAGFWTLPAGYLELEETAEDGARREAREEACADITIDGLLAVYSVTQISQVQLMYRARLKTPDFAPGVESLETALFGFDAIPWDALAFPSVGWALKHFRRWKNGEPGPFGNPA